MTAAVGLLALSLAVASGVRFEGGSVNDVLARSREDRRRVVVVVHASWCGPCRRMAKELLDTPDGEALFRNVHVMSLDPDRSPDAGYCNALAVHAYPTLIVLRPDGSEVDRVLGYGDRHAYAVRVAALLKPELTLDQLRQRRARMQSDRAAVAAIDVDIARALLKKPDRAAEGEALLEDVASSDDAVAAPEALFHLAEQKEHTHRGISARNLWRELAMRFPSSPRAPFAESRYADVSRIVYRDGGDELGFAFLRRRAFGGAADLLAERVQNLVAFCAATGLHKELARAAVDAAVRKGALDESDAAAFDKLLGR